MTLEELSLSNDECNKIHVVKMVRLSKENIFDYTDMLDAYKCASMHINKAIKDQISNLLMKPEDIYDHRETIHGCVRKMIVGMT